MTVPTPATATDLLRQANASLASGHTATFNCPKCGSRSNVPAPDFDGTGVEQCDSCLIEGLDTAEVEALVAEIRTEVYPVSEYREGFLSAPGDYLNMHMPDVDDKLAYAAIAIIGVTPEVEEPAEEVEEPGSEYTVLGIVVDDEYVVAAVLLGDVFTADSEFTPSSYERWATCVRAADVQEAEALALKEMNTDSAL